MCGNIPSHDGITISSKWLPYHEEGAIRTLNAPIYVCVAYYLEAQARVVRNIRINLSHSQRVRELNHVVGGCVHFSITTLVANSKRSSPSIRKAMVSRKRNRDIEEDEESSSDFSLVQPASDDEFDVDISSALTGKRPRKDSLIENHPDDDDGIEELIHDSISKRNMKGGTEMLKKIKSKGKSKGDIGGGSFQSMGMCSYSMNIVC